MSGEQKKKKQNKWNEDEEDKIPFVYPTESEKSWASGCNSW